MCNEVELDPATKTMVNRYLRLKANPDLDPNLFEIEFTLTREQAVALAVFVKLHGAESIRNAARTEQGEASMKAAFALLFDAIRDTGLFVG